MENKQLLIVFLVFIPFILFSQDGTLDTSFGNDGYVITDFYGQDDIPYEIGEQSDEKLIVIGRINNTSESLSTLIRYHSNGEIDTTFGDNGTIVLSIKGYWFYHNVQIQNDDTIIVSGLSNQVFILIRFLPNGVLDTNFGTDGIVALELNNGYQYLRSTVLFENGKILLIGESSDTVNLIMYNENGEIDITFGDNGISTYITDLDIRVLDGKVRDDGKIIVSAKYTDTNYDDHIIFYRFLEDGNIDINFGEDGFYEPNISHGFIYTNPIEIDNSNRIVAAYGTYDEMQEIFNSSTYRLLEDGGIDETYGNNGFLNIGSFSPTKIIIQANNRILIGGGYSFFEGSYFGIKRVLENGNIDSSFLLTYEDFQRSSFLLLNNGKILGLGNTFWFQGPENYILTRYHNDPLGIEDQKTNNLSVYPNPSSGIFKIQHDYLTDKTPYQVVDITGKIIKTGKLSGEHTEVNLSTVKSGVYFLNTPNQTMKLLKK